MPWLVLCINPQEVDDSYPLLLPQQLDMLQLSKVRLLTRGAGRGLERASATVVRVFPKPWSSANIPPAGPMPPASRPTIQARAVRW